MSNIKQAIAELEAQRKLIEAAVAALRRVGSMKVTGILQGATAGGGSNMSAESRARIAEAQRKRWAKAKREEAKAAPKPKPKQSPKPSPKPAPKPKAKPAAAVASAPETVAL